MRRQAFGLEKLQSLLVAFGTDDLEKEMQSVRELAQGFSTRCGSWRSWVSGVTYVCLFVAILNSSCEPVYPKSSPFHVMSCDIVKCSKIVSAILRMC